MNGQDDIQFIDIMKITHNKVVVYHEYQGVRKRDPLNEASNSNLKKKHTATKLTKKHRKKMKTILENWLTALEVVNYTTDRKPNFYKKKLTFATLTLPARQMHTDKEIKRLALNRIIQELRRKCKLHHYFWIIESQENGNVHFHMILDTYVAHAQLRKLWNCIMNDLEYIEHYRNNQKKWHEHGFKVKTNLLAFWDLPAQKKSYDQGLLCNWSNPNSVDIKSIDNQKNLFAYIMKYMSKGNSSRPLDGRLYGCSDGLRALRPFEDTIDNNTSDFLGQLFEDQSIKKYKSDYFQVFSGLSISKKVSMNERLMKKLINHYSYCYNLLYSN